MLVRVNAAPACEPGLDIADDTFVVAAPQALAAVVARPASWRRWWPDLELTVTRDRGVEGVQWSVRGGVTGSMEIWLQPWGDGVLLHWYLRAQTPLRGRKLDRERARRAVAWKRHVHALKDQLEGDREPGSPRRDFVVKERDEPAESP